MSLKCTSITNITVLKPTVIRKDSCGFSINWLQFFAMELSLCHSWHFHLKAITLFYKQVPRNVYNIYITYQQFFKGKKCSFLHKSSGQLQISLADNIERLVLCLQFASRLLTSICAQNSAKTYLVANTKSLALWTARAATFSLIIAMSASRATCVPSNPSRMLLRKANKQKNWNDFQACFVTWKIADSNELSGLLSHLPIRCRIPEPQHQERKALVQTIEASCGKVQLLSEALLPSLHQQVINALENALHLYSLFAW